MRNGKKEEKRRKLFNLASEILNSPAKTYMTIVVPMGAAIEIQRSSYAISEGIDVP
jgi:hypothetical protein